MAITKQEQAIFFWHISVISHHLLNNIIRFQVVLHNQVLCFYWCKSVHSLFLICIQSK